MTKKMYTNKPLIETTEPVVSENLDAEKRIRFLEDRVRQLTEQVNRMGAALALNGRQLRRQNTDINNIATTVRQKY